MIRQKIRKMNNEGIPKIWPFPKRVNDSGIFTKEKPWVKP